MQRIRAEFSLTLPFLALLCLLGPLQAQSPSPSRGYEPFTLHKPFGDLLNLTQLDPEKARIGFLQYAAAHAGTTLGAHALFEVYKLTPQGPGATAVLQRISAEYPGSRFDLGARMIPLAVGNPQKQVEDLDGLARSCGAPGLADIVQSGGSSRALTRQVEGLPIEVRRGLKSLYLVMHSELSLPTGLGQPQRGLPLAVFCQQSLGLVRGTSAVPGEEIKFTPQIEWDMMLLGVPPVAQSRVDPTVQIRSPRPDEVKGRHPKIQIQMTAGPRSNVPIDLSRVEFTLDGESILPLLKIGVMVNTEQDKPFEKIRLTGRPQQLLDRGSHSLELTVPTLGYQGSGPGQTRLNWTFQVGRDKDDKDDEERDDDLECD